MDNYILTGCDLHDNSMVLKIAHNDQAPHERRFGGDLEARQKMIAYLKRQAKGAGGAKIMFAYEASAFGYGLYDTLTDAGIQCFVFAPTKMEKSSKSKKRKTDSDDALRVLKDLRGYALAGNEMPDIWVPDHETRDDRELLRARFDAGKKVSRVKTQTSSLLKRNDVFKPKGMGENWTKAHRLWLQELTQMASDLRPGSREALSSLLRQLNALEIEKMKLDAAVAELANSARFEPFVEALTSYVGVGTLTAMVFLTEMGDPRRFKNRRTVAAYFGLIPSSNESGNNDDRKGRITAQGPSRARAILCQAQWSRIGADPVEKHRHERIVQRNPKKRKIATVAGMRRLVILLWHTAVTVQAKKEGSNHPPLPSPQRGAAPTKATGRTYTLKRTDVLSC